MSLNHQHSDLSQQYANGSTQPRQAGMPRPGLIPGRVADALWNHSQPKSMLLELPALKAIIETVDQGVLIVNQQNELVACNQQFLRMWKIPDRYASDHQAMMHYVVHQLVHPEGFIETTVAVNSQPDTDIIDEVRFKDGRTMERYSRPIRIEDQWWRIWYVRDVTSRTAVEAQAQHQDKLVALGQLVASAAHELNNPLAAVLGLAQLMLRHPLPQHLMDDLHAVEMAAQRAKHIVSDLLTFAQVQHTLRQPVDVAALIDRVVTTNVQHVHMDDIQVEVQLQSQLPLVWGDAYQLEQVLDNLLHNAIQAVREQQDPRWITVEAAATETHVLLRVTDTGPGIPPHVLPRIFDPFFTTKAVGQGTGLGLSLVYGIITKHGGTIQAESTLGQGATFSIELPIHTQLVHTTSSTVDRASTCVPQSVLVIEDELFVRLVIERGLLEHGCQVDTAPNGRDGLQKIMTGHYDLVISDLHMPGMNGNELFEQVHITQPQLNWVFITGDTMSASSESFLKQTGMPYLTKPFTLEELGDALAASGCCF